MYAVKPFLYVFIWLLIHRVAVNTVAAGHFPEEILGGSGLRENIHSAIHPNQLFRHRGRSQLFLQARAIQIVKRNGVVVDRNGSACGLAHIVMVKAGSAQAPRSGKHEVAFARDAHPLYVRDGGVARLREVRGWSTRFFVQCVRHHQSGVLVTCRGGDMVGFGGDVLGLLAVESTCI